MKFAETADWRSSIPFETPMLVAEIVPGEPVRCVTCGSDSEPLDRTELWAFKHRHPRHHDGFVRFYCREHVPIVQRRPEPAASSKAPRSRGERTVAPRRPAPSLDVVRAMCPDCFVEVSATGVCGMCGRQVA